MLYSDLDINRGTIYVTDYTSNTLLDEFSHLNPKWPTGHRIFKIALWGQPVSDASSMRVGGYYGIDNVCFKIGKNAALPEGQLGDGEDRITSLTQSEHLKERLNDLLE